MKRSFATHLVLFVLACSPALRAQASRFVVFGNGKHGYINQNGKLVIPINLEGTYSIPFSDGLAQFAEEAKPKPAKLPYVDKNGQLRIFPEGKWGFIGTDGAIVIVPKFDAVQAFSEGLAGVAFDTAQTRHNCTDCDPNQHWGFIDKQGKMVIQPQYHSVRPFAEGLAAVQNDSGKWGYIDSKGEVVIPFSFKVARGFSEGLAPAALSDQIGFIDKKGRFAVKPQFSAVNGFSEGFAAVRTGGKTGFMILGPASGKWSFIGKDGKKGIDLPHKTEQARDFSEGLAIIEIHGHCGYINTTGAFVIPPRFSACEDFSEGLANVFGEGKWQYVDKRGRVILTVPYWGVDPFKNGLAAIEDGAVGPEQGFGYIDTHGNLIWNPRPAL
jgi:hypothetical protein